MVVHGCATHGFGSELGEGKKVIQLSRDRESRPYRKLYHGKFKKEVGRTRGYPQYSPYSSMRVNMSRVHWPCSSVSQSNRPMPGYVFVAYPEHKVVTTPCTC